jgi:hypothetical protein
VQPDLSALLYLARGFRALVLTNAMKPMHKVKPALLRLRDRYGDRLTIRVSIDHYGRAVHEAERGRRSWASTIDGLKWLATNGFAVAVASRRLSGESEDELRRGFARLSNSRERRIRPSSPAPCCLTIRASILGRALQARSARCRSTTRIAPSFAFSAAAPAAGISRNFPATRRNSIYR